jgi:hypothetical protein
MLPGQVLWVHSHLQPERLLLGREAMLLQGFPISEVDDGILDGVSDRFLHDLAGNAMCSQVLLAVVQSAVSALRWRPPGEAPQVASKQDVHDVMELLSQITG